MSEWIDVTTAMPPADETPLLVLQQPNKYMLGYFDGATWWLNDGQVGGARGLDITHWRPLIPVAFEEMQERLAHATETMKKLCIQLNHLSVRLGEVGAILVSEAKPGSTKET